MEVVEKLLTFVKDLSAIAKARGQLGILHVIVFPGLILCLVLLYLNEYITRPMSCLVPEEDKSEAVNSYCLSHGTFTEEINSSGLLEIKKQKYYLWVPYFLIFTVIVTILPSLCVFQQDPFFIYLSTRINYPLCLQSKTKNSKTIDRKKKIEETDQIISKEVEDFLENIAIYVNDRIKSGINKYWFVRILLCELIQLFVIIFLICITEIFLNGNFINFLYVNQNSVFPKTSKCTYYMFGPSGSLLKLDSLCIMTLNLYNPVTFLVLWYCYVILVLIQCLFFLSHLCQCFIHCCLCITLKANDLETKQWLVNLSYHDLIFLDYLKINIGEFLQRRITNIIIFKLKCH